MAFYALKDIKAGDELSFDSLTSSKPDAPVWPATCLLARFAVEFMTEQGSPTRRSASSRSPAVVALMMPSTAAQHRRGHARARGSVADHRRPRPSGSGRGGRRVVGNFMLSDPATAARRVNCDKGRVPVLLESSRRKAFHSPAKRKMILTSPHVAASRWPSTRGVAYRCRSRLGVSANSFANAASASARPDSRVSL